ncbi:GNAT family N-acetyltransferase [Candidatus Fermentibacteria bacterium]|nr:GNAT family N-acetyltransferase [Candidatus Fermentibacteria bacterium]
MSDVRMVEYDDGLAAALVRMWRESAESWPPGFPCESKTPDWIRQKHENRDYIHTTLAMTGDRVVGYIRTKQYGGEPEAAYVAFVNVVTDMQGQGIGKKLLLDSIARVTEQGYYRLDLDTWPANKLAVPLYKKAGFIWVPETDVHMECYVPALLQRPEFMDFLGGKFWYDCHVRNTDIATDEERSSCGRRIFTYEFDNGEEKVRAEFDLAGRLLSGWRGAGIDGAVEPAERKFYFGKPVELTISGKDLPGRIPVESDEELRTPEAVKAGKEPIVLRAVPNVLDVPYARRERAPRVWLELLLQKPLRMGVGVAADDPVVLKNTAERVIPGQKKLRLDLKRRQEVKSATLSYRFDEGPTSELALDTSRATFFSAEVPLPDLSPGAHTLTVSVRTESASGGAREVLLTKGPLEQPLGWRSARVAVMETDSLRAVLYSRGGHLRIGPTGEQWAHPLSVVRLTAGPPLFGGDLPKQRYTLEVDGEGIHASCDWPSHPGVGFSQHYRLGPDDVLEGYAEVHNRSESPASFFFGAIGWGRLLRSGSFAMPIEETVLHSQVHEQLFPDFTTDFPRRVDDLPQPWLGNTRDNITCLATFDGWERLDMVYPRTEPVDLEPGGTLRSPLIRQITSIGGLKSVLGRASNKGWIAGRPPDSFTRFPEVEIPPVCPTGTEVTLRNPARGTRKACLYDGKEALAETDLSPGQSLSAKLEVPGQRSVELALGGVRPRFPVRVVETDASAEASGRNGNLHLGNDRFDVLINPEARGHVHSLKVEGKQWLHASDPEPSTFAYFSPWFGGIVPSVSLEGRFMSPLRLEDYECSSGKKKVRLWGFELPSWETSWTIDEDERCSIRITWTVSIFPGLPLIRTVLLVTPLAGHPFRGNTMVEGFFSPDGNLDSIELSYGSPRKVHCRDNPGCWTFLDGPGRLTGPAGGFVEAYPEPGTLLLAEDYSSMGCFLTAMALPGPTTRSACTWLVGRLRKDGGIAAAMSAYEKAVRPIFR